MGFSKEIQFSYHLPPIRRRLNGIFCGKDRRDMNRDGEFIDGCSCFEMGTTASLCHGLSRALPLEAGKQLQELLILRRSQRIPLVSFSQVLHLGLTT